MDFKFLTLGFNGAKCQIYAYALAQLGVAGSIKKNQDKISFFWLIKGIQDNKRLDKVGFVFIYSYKTSSFCYIYSLSFYAILCYEMLF